MTEYHVTTTEGIRNFQSDHEAKLLGELADLDNFLHEHPDQVTHEHVERHRLLSKLHDQAANIVNGFIQTNRNSQR